MLKRFTLACLLLCLLTSLSYADGHKVTGEWWTAVLKIQSDLEGLLENIKEQSEQSAKENRTTKTEAFQALLRENLPGAELTSARGSGYIVLTNNGRAEFDQLTHITTITQKTETLTRRFFFRGNNNPYNFSATNGTNTAHLMVNAEHPDRSRFVSLTIPALKIGEKKASQMANDVYVGYVASSEGLGINQLAEVLLSKPEAQQALLDTAQEVDTAPVVDPAPGVVAPKAATPRSTTDLVFNSLCAVAIILGFLLISKFRKKGPKKFRPRPSVPVTPPAYGYLNNFCQDCGKFRPGPEGQCLEFASCTVRLGQQQQASYVHSPPPQVSRPQPGFAENSKTSAGNHQ